MAILIDEVLIAARVGRLEQWLDEQPSRQAEKDLDEQPSRQAEKDLVQSQFPTSKKNARSNLGGRSSELFVSHTISQDLTSESANQSNLLCALKSRPRKVESRNIRSAEKSGWAPGAHAFPKSLSRG
jgi:hypothetical protein